MAVSLKYKTRVYIKVERERIMVNCRDSFDCPSLPL